MQSWLIVSYKRVKQGSFHPSRGFIKFSPVAVVESASVLKDSIGGPKVTYIRSVMRDDIDLFKHQARRLHSFVVSEHQQDLGSLNNPVLIFSKVELRLELSAPIPKIDGSHTMDGEAEPIYQNPKLHMVVHEESSPVPVVIINQDTIFVRQLFSAHNRIWFDRIMGGQTIFHLAIGNRRGMIGLPVSNTSEITSKSILRILREWVSPRSTHLEGGPTIFLPEPQDAKFCIDSFYSVEKREFDEIQEFLLGSIPKLDKGNRTIEGNPEWPAIQDGVLKMLTFVETFESNFHGFTALVKEGVNLGDQACQRYHKFKSVLQETPENPWLSKSYLRTNEMTKRFSNYFEFVQQLPFDFTGHVGQILSVVDESYPGFQLLPIRELALVMVLRSTLLASNSHRQLKQESLCKILSPSLAPGSALTPNPSEVFKHLALCRNYALMMDETMILRVWRRNNYANRNIDCSREYKHELNDIQSRVLCLKQHTDKYLVFKSGVTTFKYQVIETSKFLDAEPGATNFLKTINLGANVGTYTEAGFGLCRGYLLQIVQTPLPDAKFSHKAAIVPLTAELGSDGPRTDVVLELGDFADKCLLNACYTSSRSNRFYLSFVHRPDTPAAEVDNSGWTIKLGCWELIDKTLVRLALTDIPPFQDLSQARLTGRRALSLKQVSPVSPSFVESRGQVFYLHSPAPKYILLYAFHKNTFLPVGGSKKGLHRLPQDVSLLMSTGESTPLSPYIAKQIGQEPKRFLIQMLQVMY